MHDIIEKGQALYWATSEWSAARITRAVEICERLGLQKPIADQCQYNAFTRDNVEKYLRPVFEDYSYGAAIWSPLSGGLLTGKYNDGELPGDSRFEKNEMLKGLVIGKYFGEKRKEETIRILTGLAAVAKKHEVTQAQLAIAWTLVNADVSTCLLGASKLSQLEANLKALDLAAKWTEELEKEVNDVLGNTPEPDMDFRFWAPKAGRRTVQLDFKIDSQLEDIYLPEAKKE